jgi:hypothetical protein
MTEPLTDEERDYLNTPDEVIRKLSVVRTFGSDRDVD